MAERSIAVRLLADVANYVQGFGRAKAATGDLVTELSKSEQQRQNFQRLGTGMLVAGAGIAAGIGLATKAAIDWESSWAGVVKTVDGTDAQLAALEEELREMARTLPATHAEIAAVAEAAGQLGVATEDIADFTRTMIDLGETTNLTADEAATSIAQLMNVMGTAPADVDRLGAALVELGNNGASTEAQIIAMAQRIAGAGAVVGASEADVLALANALASAGIAVEAGGSAISKVLVSIASSAAEGGDAIEGFARVAGVSADEFADHFARDPIAALNMFVLGLGRMDAAGQNVFGTLDELGLSEVRTRDALLRLSQSGDLLTQSLEDGTRAWGENVALTDEAEKRYQTAAARIQIARNQLTDFAIEMGATFLPVVADAADALGGFVGFLGDLPDPLVAAIGVTAALAAATLLLGGTAITAVTKIAAYRAALAQLQTQGGVTATAVGKVSGGLRGGVIWAGRAVAAFAALQLAALAVEAAFAQDLNAQIDAMMVGLERFARDGEVAGEVARVLGEDMEDLALAFRLLGPEGLGPDIGNTIKKFLSPGEWAKAEGSLRHAKEEIQALDASMAQLVESGNVEVAAEVFRRLGEIAEENGVSVERLKELFPAYAAALEVAAEESGETGSEIAGMGDQAAGAAEDVEKLKEAFDRLFASQMDADRALIGYKQGLADLREEIKSGTATLNINSQAGRDNRGAVLDQIEAINELREANIDGGMAIDDANKKYQKQLDALIELLVQEGFNERAVRDLIGAYRDIPDDVKTDIEQPGMPRAKDDAEALRRRYHNLPPRKETRISAPGMSGVIGGLRQYLETLARIPRSVHTTVTRSGGTRPGFQERRYGGITLHNVDGGLYAAQAGLLRRASIFGPSSPARFAFAEPETGGEAFIPRLGDRERSLAIADQAARWHGGRVIAGDGAAALGAAQRSSSGSRTPIVNVQVIATPRQSAGQLAEALMDTIQHQVRIVSGGDVQRALGQG